MILKRYWRKYLWKKSLRKAYYRYMLRGQLDRALRVAKRLNDEALIQETARYKKELETIMKWVNSLPDFYSVGNN